MHIALHVNDTLKHGDVLVFFADHLIMIDEINNSIFLEQKANNQTDMLSGIHGYFKINNNVSCSVQTVQSISIYNMSVNVLVRGAV